MNELFLEDYEIFTPNKYKVVESKIRQFRNHELRYIYLGRKKQTINNTITKKS